MASLDEIRKAHAQRSDPAFSRELIKPNNNPALANPKRHGYVDANGTCKYCHKSEDKHRV